MPVEKAGIRISPLDTARFGIVTARADGLDHKQLKQVFDFCSSHQVQLLIARSDVEDIATTHALGKAGFTLMDTLVYYERDLARSPVTGPFPDSIELLGPGDAEQVEEIARECFQDYSGHFHADPRLDRNACTETYVSWARACCDRAEPSGFVLVAGAPDRRVGFSGFRRTNPDEGELLLGAVLPVARGAGLYRTFTLAGMLRVQLAGATRFVTSTHLSNWSAQSAWTAAGLRLSSAHHTFHRWFDDP